ncbi:hypothetical protein NZD89_04175 [Alicyclobacillus fastidiosus]|uniref:Flagellar protein FliT n=1 Tax=Alicyclobacillus fastidiosus TaxID=392011 RepID=A0ABY6ZJ83_9BACL|nr:hypothetical protein [Alicyclobacillus fastidiosus]WAH42648.1 hypothetical protein NZD89_04175 [Alicyclobacillus fastidiosus]
MDIQWYLKQIHEQYLKALDAVSEERFDELFYAIQRRSELMQNLKLVCGSVSESDIQVLVDDTHTMITAIKQRLRETQAGIDACRRTSEVSRAYARFMRPSSDFGVASP